jgi:hypothetical protein
MKLNRLKKNAYDNWQCLNRSKSAIPGEGFKKDIRKFGDLRRRNTWIKALAHYYAHSVHSNCLDAWSLITVTLNFTPDQEYYEIRHEIFDAFLMFSDSLELIKMGFEQLLSIDFTQQEKENMHGFFELVAEQQQRGSTALIDRGIPLLSPT